MVIIVGGGEGGLRLAALLRERSVEVRVVEHRGPTCAVLRERLGSPRVVHGSGTDPAVLEAAGLRDASLLVAVTGSDATNLAVAQLGRFRFGVPRVVARVNVPRHGWLFRPEGGVDLAVDPSELVARIVAGDPAV